jgi:hypothetical protein
MQSRQRLIAEPITEAVRLRAALREKPTPTNTRSTLMTEYRTPTGVVREPAPDTSDQAKQEAAATKDEAKRQAGETAQTAKAQASQVADEAKAQARNVVDEAKRVGTSRAEEQTANAAGALRQFEQQAQALLDGRPEDAGVLGDYARQLTGALGRYAARIDELGFEGVVRETSGFARRRPGAFLLAAAGAGLIVGRLGRGIKDAPSGNGAAVTTSREPSGAIPPTTFDPTTSGPTTAPSTAPTPVSGVGGAPEPVAGSPRPSFQDEDAWTADDERTWRPEGDTR